MIKPFYSNYTIDDSGIGCEKVVVSKCDVPGSGMPNHEYKSICELIADCPSVRQLTNDCIVDFFNSDWSKVYDTTVQKFLKLKSNGCLEWAPVVCPCGDELVGATKDDPNPGYLVDKIVGAENGPYKITISPKGSSTLVATPFGPNNIFTNFKDGDIAECGKTDIGATLRIRNGQLETVCNDEISHSYAKWVFSGGSCVIPTGQHIDIYVTNTNDHGAAPYVFEGNASLETTPDVKAGSGIYLFELTQPGIYVVNCNSTVRNITEAGLQAIRGGLLVRQFQDDGTYKAVEFGDFKYDSRTYTNYVNDFAPDEFNNDYLNGERNLELAIMSFNTTYTIAVSETSASKPVKIGFHVRVDTHLHDHRAETANQQLKEIELELTNDSKTVGPRTTITCVRVSEYPASGLIQRLSF